MSLEVMTLQIYHMVSLLTYIIRDCDILSKKKSLEALTWQIYHIVILSYVINLLSTN